MFPAASSTDALTPVPPTSTASVRGPEVFADVARRADFVVGPRLLRRVFARFLFAAGITRVCSSVEVMKECSYRELSLAQVLMTAVASISTLARESSRPETMMIDIAG